VKRWIARSLLATSTMAIVAAPAGSAQAACPVLDPLCEVQGAVDDGVDVVEETVDAIETPVDDVLDRVVETVDPVIDTIIGTVDDVLGGGGGEQPEPPGGTGNDRGDLPGIHRGGAEPPGVPDRGAPDIAGGPRIHERPENGPVTGSSVLPHPASDADGPRVTGGGRVGAALGAIARSVAIVLTLFGLTVAFAAIQDRFDRSDPRLSLAPTRSDVVTFA
jgi:hypothetical protein